MDLQIAESQITTKITTIRKYIQYALDDLPKMKSTDRSADLLEKLLDLMDDGTNVKDSPVPNRIAGDLSFKEELTYINNVTLTIGNNYA